MLCQFIQKFITLYHVKANYTYITSMNNMNWVKSYITDLTLGVGFCFQ